MQRVCCLAATCKVGSHSSLILVPAAARGVVAIDLLEQTAQSDALDANWHSLPEKLWLSHPCKCPRPGWPTAGVGTGWTLRSLPAQTILGFHDLFVYEYKPPPLQEHSLVRGEGET